MTALRPPVLIAALLLAVAPAASASPLPPGGNRSPPPPPPAALPGFPAFPVFFYDDEPTVIIEREVVREVAVPQPAPPPPEPPREPWVLGRTYASLPGGCMKLIEGGASYYLCSGEWYRQVGARQYKAVARP